MVYVLACAEWLRVRFWLPCPLLTTPALIVVAAAVVKNYDSAVGWHSVHLSTDQNSHLKMSDVTILQLSNHLCLMKHISLELLLVFKKLNGNLNSYLSFEHLRTAALLVHRSLLAAHLERRSPWIPPLLDFSLDSSLPRFIVDFLCLFFTTQ